MKTRLYILLLSSLFCQLCQAQKPTHSWYFGKRIGLDFNESPPRVLSDGILQAVEGCASVADENGNLLFYTNGTTIANKQHEIMQNGNGLAGDLSSTDNTVIVRLPGTDSIYYVFTIGAASGLINAFSYSVVNINRQNGLGEVTQKNVLVWDNTFEKLAAVRHCNRKDVWITIKEWSSDAYRTFLLTKDGLDPNPVTSNMSLSVSGLANNVIGALKFSSDGEKLIALHSFENDVAQLMRFDNSTGILSDEILFRPNLTPSSAFNVGVYGASFSPDNRLLYISSRNNAPERSVLYQYDISSHDETIINNSRYVVSSQDNFEAGALQMGPDKKIYFSHWRAPGLSVIENPNVMGAGCNYQNNSILFPFFSEPVQYGLPNFVAGDLDSNYVPYNFSWNLLSCNSFTIQFTQNTLAGLDSVKWSMGDGNLYQTFNPQHTYLQPGTYQVSLEIFKQDCGAASEIIIQTIQVGRSAISNSFLRADTSFCDEINYTIRSNTTLNNYLWSTGETTRDISVTTAGLYWLEVTKDGCSYRDSINIILNPAIQADLGDDKPVCVNKPLVLSSPSSGGSASYLWSNGSTQSNIEINMPGTYWVQVKNAAGCMASDTVRTLWGDCDIYIPSAFSPNGDGINETFGLVNGITSSIFTFYIYNRYGQLVFTTKDAFQKWDGTIKGKPSPNGAYVWMMTYKNKEGFIQTDKGTVMLIR